MADLYELGLGTVLLFQRGRECILEQAFGCVDSYVDRPLCKAVVNECHKRRVLGGPSLCHAHRHVQGEKRASWSLDFKSHWFHFHLWFCGLLMVCVCVWLNVQGHGFRKELATMISDLNPGFLRFPGKASKTLNDCLCVIYVTQYFGLGYMTVEPHYEK